MTLIIYMIELLVWNDYKGYLLSILAPLKNNHIWFALNGLKFLVKLNNIDYTWIGSCLHGVNAYNKVIILSHSMNDVAC